MFPVHLFIQYVTIQLHHHQYSVSAYSWTQGVCCGLFQLSCGKLNVLLLLLLYISWYGNRFISKGLAHEHNLQFLEELHWVKLKVVIFFVFFLIRFSLQTIQAHFQEKVKNAQVRYNCLKKWLCLSAVIVTFLALVWNGSCICFVFCFLSFCIFFCIYRPAHRERANWAGWKKTSLGLRSLWCRDFTSTAVCNLQCTGSLHL